MGEMLGPVTNPFLSEAVKSAFSLNWLQRVRVNLSCYSGPVYLPVCNGHKG